MTPLNIKAGGAVKPVGASRARAFFRARLSCAVAITCLRSRTQCLASFETLKVLFSETFSSEALLNGNTPAAEAGYEHARKSFSGQFHTVLSARAELPGPPRL